MSTTTNNEEEEVTTQETSTDSKTEEISQSEIQESEKKTSHEFDDNEMDVHSLTPDTQYESYLDDKNRTVYKIIPDGSITKTMITSVNEDKKPFILGRVWINVKGETKSGVVFEEFLKEERDFILGKGQHCKGVEMALSTMNIGEHCLIHINNPKYSYSESRKPEKCPSKDNKDEFPLKFSVILIDSINERKASHEMSFKEQYDLSNEFRTKGNDRFHKNRYKTALRLYEKSIQCLEAMTDINTIPKEELELSNDYIKPESINETKLKNYLNCCVCNLRLKNYLKSIDYANKVIKIDDTKAKAYIRRAVCYRELNKFNDALRDVKKYLELVKDNDKLKKIGVEHMVAIKKRKKKNSKKQKEMYGGFLTKNSSKSKKKGFQLYDDKKIENPQDNMGFFERTLFKVGGMIEYTIDSCINGCTNCFSVFSCCRNNKKDKNE